MKASAKRFVPALLALAAAAVAAADAPASLPLVLTGTGPTYTLPLTLAARPVSARADLSDLRVRNAAGEAMAFAWAETPAPVTAPQRAPARLYKVPLPPADAASATDGAPRQAWIVDAHDAQQDLLSVELGLERGTQGAWTLRIESSDDLQHWSTLQEEAQVVQLQARPQVGAAGALNSQASREQLKSDAIDLGDVRARYLRLTTVPRSGIPPLVSATVVRAPHRLAPPPLEWSEAIAPTHCEANACEYALPRNVPVDALQVATTEADTIGQVVVSGHGAAPARETPARHSLLRGSLHALRHKAERANGAAVAAWEDAGVVNVYWLTQPGGAPDLRSPSFRLNGEAWTTVRLETFGPINQLGRTPPTLKVGVHPRQLAFVARGAGPFTLARAGAAETTAPMALAQLMPGRPADAPLPEATATIVAPAAASAPVTTASAIASAVAQDTPAKAPWLWAALLAGLGVMGAMAWSLLRKPKAD